MSKKIPLTKAGKPDKRYTKSLGSLSKATGQAPSKHLKARRAKPVKPGYFPNPVNEKYTVHVVTATRIGYVAGFGKKGLIFDDDMRNALTLSKEKAAMIKKMGEAFHGVRLHLKKKPR